MSVFPKVDTPYQLPTGRGFIFLFTTLFTYGWLTVWKCPIFWQLYLIKSLYIRSEVWCPITCSTGRSRTKTKPFVILFPCLTERSRFHEGNWHQGSRRGRGNKKWFIPSLTAPFLFQIGTAQWEAQGFWIQAARLAVLFGASVSRDKLLNLSELSHHTAFIEKLYFSVLNMKTHSSKKMK